MRKMLKLLPWIALAVCVLTVCAAAWDEYHPVCPDDAHVMGEWRVTKQPNCVSVGEQRRDCLNCIYFEVEGIPKAPENHGPAMTVGAAAATCTAPGYSGDEVCSYCKKELLAGSVLPALGHNTEVWMDVQPATCAAGGKQQGVCTRCGKPDTRNTQVDPDNHTGQTEVKNEKKAACLTAGYTGDTVCKSCKKVLASGETIPALGHSFGDWARTKAATCAAAGEKTRVCERCGKKETEVLPVDPENHTGLTEVKNEKTAACLTAGYSGDTVCKGCKMVLSSGETIPALGHSFGGWALTKAATCAAAGEKTRVCDRCGKKENEVLPVDPENHAAGTVKTGQIAPTCVRQGYTGDEVCRGCKAILSVGETLPAAGHRYAAWIVVAPATEKRAGSMERVCTVCGAKDRRTVPAGNDPAITPELPTDPAAGSTTNGGGRADPSAAPTAAEDVSRSAADEDVSLYPEDLLLGDVNLNGQVTASDARLALRIAAKLNLYTDRQKLQGDVDFNDTINARDARKILRVCAKLESFDAPPSGKIRC